MNTNRKKKKKKKRFKTNFFFYNVSKQKSMKTNRPPQPLDPRSENKMHRSSPDAGVVQPISYFHFFFVFFPAKTISNSFLYNHDTFRSVIIMFSFHNNNVPPVFFFSVSRYICRYICVRVNCVIDLDHFFFLYES